MGETSPSTETSSHFLVWYLRFVAMETPQARVLLSDAITASSLQVWVNKPSGLEVQKKKKAAAPVN